MKKLYEKSEVWFAVAWIIAYCVLMSLGDNLSSLFGIAKIATLPIALILSLGLFMFIKKNALLKEYGLCKANVPASKMLFYIPIIIIMTTNLWYGVAVNFSLLETLLYILTMLLVGFQEELIFRGLLFKAMAKDNVRTAIIVSSITFGLGHIINLFNGSGAALLSNVLQMIYASVVGFMFVIIFYKTKSIIPCVITHGVINSLSAFANTSAITDEKEIVTAVILAQISGAYAVYIAHAVKSENRL